MSRTYPVKVSVLIVTYNQERYIEQAVRSALSQQTKFDFEIVIGEDCSKDRTREICRRLAADHPQIRVIEREQNLGMVENHRQTHYAGRGQYLAMLEGDDYWIDPLKLQKQVDFLEVHSECALCFHNVIVYDRDSNDEWLYVPEGFPPISGVTELLRENHINTSSVLMRNGLFERFPPRDESVWMADWPFYLYLTTFGKLGYLPDVMACYRHHPAGTWMNAPLDQQIAAVWNMYDFADKLLKGEHHDLIQSLKERFAAITPVEGARRSWKKRAVAAEKRIEQLERARRVAKLRQRS